MLPKLELLKSQKQECKLFEGYIKKKSSSGCQLNILEAGCGRFWPINMSGVQYSLTGVDVNKDAIEIRQTRQEDLIQ